MMDEDGDDEERVMDENGGEENGDELQEDIYWKLLMEAPDADV